MVVQPVASAIGEFLSWIIRVQVLLFKHVTSRQPLDGMSESLGPTASETIFQASSRTGKRSAGLKKTPRRGCRRKAPEPLGRLATGLGGYRDANARPDAVFVGMALRDN
jgi:hypothetical protein